MTAPDAPAQPETPRPDSAALIDRFGEAMRMLTYDQVTLVAGKAVRQEYADAKAALVADLAAKDAEIARLRGVLAEADKAINPPDFGGISLDKWNVRLKAATASIRAALAGETRT